MPENWIYFAIGDVHGELGKLRALHAAILDRVKQEGRPARIMHLGDYVDRGPNSRGVVEYLMQLQAKYPEGGDIEVHALMGNHEALMVDAWLNENEPQVETWFHNGGGQTLNSYGCPEDVGPNEWRDFVPYAHIHWLRNLPTLVYDIDRKLAFVHAGIDPANFPECREEIHLWTRSRKFFADNNWPHRKELIGLTVVHGHTPTDGFMPEFTFRRVNVDTGACFGGPLTAVIIKDDDPLRFLHAS